VFLKYKIRARATYLAFVEYQTQILAQKKEVNITVIDPTKYKEEEI